ncbi:MAG: GTPase Der [Candidatus Magasanikbacteria bacterium GW2011_GWA2_45_39]|uniref:GTPase Der n=2 Tax=Candidatus Magasanikiibacteriota TaxID=1752731 RepID=A0A0G1Q7M2_9BACT|nr:MAG: GTPase Der [Candidatus Magasanikbacteria bacterium GW2011_GWA2_45_39]KKU13713.1 MAG: GTPase Der [Candidatus Magasanikbacteria bacterium GW2011_GWC2_45_8]HBW73646.1 ribosome biogenesis GTPase Der [Candidatus Magasanikbacteria bacterium]
MDIKRLDTTYPLITIVGRTNVGKSTLFNKLVGAERALVSKQSGTTRTSNFSIFWWRGAPFRIADTGGMDFDSREPFTKDIQHQIEKALKASEAILFLVDVREGVLPQEKRIAQILKKIKKPVTLIINKADSKKLQMETQEKEWRSLGLGLPLAISAANGSGVGDMLDHITKTLAHAEAPKEHAEQPVTVSLIGRPNVGKSSLFNALIGEDRVIVNPTPHTTRESHNTLVSADGFPYLFIDTAGMRRKSKVTSDTLEQLSIKHTIASLLEAKVCILLLDATEPFSNQDQHLAGLIAEKQKGLIIAVNKWDLIPGAQEEKKEHFARELGYHFPFLRYAPVVFLSAKTHERVHKLYGLILAVHKARQMEIPQPRLNSFLKRLVLRHKPVRGRGTRHPRILRFIQTAIDPPTFEITIKQKTSVHPSYLRFMENALREQFELIGTPVVVYVHKARSSLPGAVKQPTV